MQRSVLALNLGRLCATGLFLLVASNCSKPPSSAQSNATTSTHVFNRDHIRLTSSGSRQARATWARRVAMADTDPDGHKQLTAGSWNSDSNLTTQGGQIMNFALTDVNALPTTITISANGGESHSLNLAPFTTQYMQFSTFGSVPMGWSFDISTNSDAFIVNYILYSSWVPGDPSNG